MTGPAGTTGTTGQALAKISSTKQARPIPFAIIGRQVCEIQYDLLNLLVRGAD